MRKFWLMMIFWSVVLLGLAACTPTSEDATDDTAVATLEAQPAEELVDVVEPAACDSSSGQRFSSDEAGYCFVYPADYCWLPGQDALTNTFVSMASVDAETNRCPDEPLILHGEVVWVGVNVSPANGQSLEDAAAVVIEGLEDFGLELSEVIVGGETAVQINNMPGQDISRELLILHNDQLYRLTFVPASADYGDRYTEMEALYTQLIDSFEFLP